MENKVYLLTTRSCTKCPMVKNMIEEKGLDIEYVDVEEDAEIASEAGVMAVPSIVVIEDGEYETHVGQGACMEFISKES